jgi:hypothetical protein
MIDNLNQLAGQMGRLQFSVEKVGNGEFEQAK